jgi:hypothetical protein
MVGRLRVGKMGGSQWRNKCDVLEIDKTMNGLGIKCLGVLSWRSDSAIVDRRLL